MIDKFDKSKGLNSSEQRLTALGETTFLRMWSYANVHVGRERKGKLIGKELADLLVICGEHVIVFSDKEISWPKSGNKDVDWCRWFRNSIKSSVHQLHKAERWLREFPNSLYIDNRCSVKLPIDIPNAHSAKIHGVLIASGAEQACLEHFGGGSGSLVISSDIRDDDHINPDADTYQKFCVGDVNSSGSFLHVFDAGNIQLLLSELNTISDFVEYLSSRERFLRSGKSIFACGEEDLLTFYLQGGRDDGSHDFLERNVESLEQFDSIMIEEEIWRSYIRRPEYIAKKKDERQSYIWDWMIEKFAKHVLEGTAPIIRGHKPEVQSTERALRIMAMEPRVRRRGLAQSLIAAMDAARINKYPRFCRYVFSDVEMTTSKKAYVFLILAFDPDKHELDAYDEYRNFRIGFLETYCLGLLLKYPNLETVVGIAFDADESVTGKRGGSEDLMAVEQGEWIEPLRQQIETNVDVLGILDDDRAQRGEMSVAEYPETRKMFGNRQQRRAAERARQKAQKRSR